MTDGTFRKIGDSAERMYGPRALLVCGFSSSDQDALLQMLDCAAIRDVAVVFATAENMGSTLAEVLALPDLSGRGEPCESPRAVILSGLTEKELHRVISGYKGLGLPLPIWATLTPHSEHWALSELLHELRKEQRALAGR